MAKPSKCVMFNLYEALRNHLAQRQNELKVRFVAASVATLSPRSKPDKARVVAGVAAIGKAITSTTAIIQWLKKEGAHLYVVGNTLCFRPTDWSQFTIVNAHWRAFFMNSWQSIRSREMARVDKRAGRNFGFGRQLSYAGPQALKDLFGDGHFATVKAHSDRWQAFMNWCRSDEGPGLNDARQIDREILMRYAAYMRQQLDQGYVGIATAQNRLSTVNRTMAALRGDQYVKISSPSKALGLQRSSVRGEVPQGQDRAQVELIARALSERGQQRVAAIVHLARETGMRLREAILADLPRLQREAGQLGKINI